MSELWRLIESHLDHYGVSAAAFARKCDTNAQTVQNWKDRATALPKPHHLKAVARVIGAPYEMVLGAALVDAGYRDAIVDDAASLRDRLEVTAQRENAKLAALAEEMVRELGMPPPPPRHLENPQAGVVVDPIGDFVRRDLQADHGDDGGQEAG